MLKYGTWTEILYHPFFSQGLYLPPWQSTEAGFPADDGLSDILTCLNVLLTKASDLRYLTQATTHSRDALLSADLIRLTVKFDACQL